MKEKSIFYLIGGPIAAGKSTLMESKLYNTTNDPVNLFDHDREKLMVQLYAPDEKKMVKGLTIGKALTNAIEDSIDHAKDFMLQVHFTTEQEPQINSYFHKYGNKFEMQAHFITVNNIAILKNRAEKREFLGGHSSESKSIDKTYEQSFKNFLKYIPKLEKATVWDNSEEFGFSRMQPQFVYVNGKLGYQNPDMTPFAHTLLLSAEDFLANKSK